MKLIDKEKVVAEIKRRVSNHNKELQHASDDDFVSSWASDEENQKLALTALIPFLDTLEMKEVNDDKWLIKATEWLSANLHRYDEHIGLSAKEFVEKFSKEVWQQPPVNLWKPADGDDLPELEREVVALCQPYPLEGNECSVTFAHRPNPNGWDGKSVTTGKVEHYTPKTYDKGGWNIPDVKIWLDYELPKMEE